MELFERAKAVRLRSRHDKYLVADEDEEHVIQDRNAGASRVARWNVEFVEGQNLIRLKSCFGKYLTASNAHFLLGMTGKKVVQSKLSGVATEWEPVREGFLVKLRTQHGTFLRANGGVPPWRNSVTHDVPHRTATQDWVLWDVDIVDIVVQKPEVRPHEKVAVAAAVVPQAASSFPASPRSVLNSSPKSAKAAQVPSKLAKLESSSSFAEPIPKLEGRAIYYTVAKDNANIETGISWPQFNFIGTSLPELTERLKRETQLDDIIICTRNPVNQRLSPLQLELPPSNATMRIVVVDACSRLGRSFFKI